MVKKSVNNPKDNSKNIIALVTETKENKKKIKVMEERMAQLDEINKKLARILNSNKTSYEKKIALFKIIENLEVGEMPLEKKKRADYLLQTHLYDDLAKQSMRDYKKITAETFSKTT